MPPTKFQIKQAQKKGKRYGIKPSDLLDIIEHESSFQPGAVSSAGAFGLSQFIPSTAASYGVKRGTSKKAQKSQIRGEAKYLKDLGWGKGTPSSIQHALAGYYGAASPYAADVISSHTYEKYDKGKKQIAIGPSGKSGKKTVTSKQRVLSQPAVDKAAARGSAAFDFISNPNPSFEDFLGFTKQIASLQDKPAKFKTVKTSKQVKRPGQIGTAQVKQPVHKKHLKAKPTKAIVQLGKQAQAMGLNVGENPHFGGVAPVHATNSYHYVGRAIDVSGTPEQMAKFAKKMAKKYGSRLAEMFWNGPGARNIDNGKPVPKGYVSDHTDHVHLAI